MVAALLLTSGCSFLSVRKAPPLPLRSPPQQVSCTSSRVAPAVDLTLGVVASLISVPLLGARDSCPPNEFCIDVATPIFQLIGAGFLTLGVVDLLSSGYGFVQTGDCAKIVDWVQACNAGNQEACSRLGAPGRSPPSTVQ
jgi:hypothetical protein